MSPNELPYPSETRFDLSMVAASNRRVGRRAWERMLSTVGAGGVMVTLGFRTRLGHALAVETANHFLCRINRRLFGKRYHQNGQSLHGAVVLEKKRRSSKAHDSPHFHFIVLGDSVGNLLNDEKQLRAVVQHEAGRLQCPTLDQFRPFGPPLSGADFVDVTRIHFSDGLANYVTIDNLCRDSDTHHQFCVAHSSIR